MIKRIVSTEGSGGQRGGSCMNAVKVCSRQYLVAVDSVCTEAGLNMEMGEGGERDEKERETEIERLRERGGREGDKEGETGGGQGPFKRERSERAQECALERQCC